MTGLDYVGIPVAAAVRPNSRSLSVHQGKGVSIVAARVSAAMEAVEFHCAGALRAADRVAASRALKRGAFLAPGRLVAGRVPADAPLEWLDGRRLPDDAPVLVPRAAVALDFRLGAETPPFHQNSNGLAAGGSRDEALLHGLCELIERDGLALWTQSSRARKRATRVDPAALAGDGAVAFHLGRLDGAGMRVEVWETTSDLGVPSFLAAIDDRDARPPFLGRFHGNGCHPCAAVALARALAEAAQSRLTLISGARDDLEPVRYAEIGQRRNLAALLQADDTPVAPTAPRAASFDGDGVAEDLAAVLRRLARAGLRDIVAVDIADPALDVPCVRVFAPGLEGAPHMPHYRPGPWARRAAAGA